MPNYWIGIAAGISLSATNIENTWWCMPFDAEKGDLLLLYCPRSASVPREGIFAESVINSQPVVGNYNNRKCSGFGSRINIIYGYTDIYITKRFSPTLTAKEMKSNMILKNSNFVKRNFQGTTFRIDLNTYQVILKLINAKYKLSCDI